MKPERISKSIHRNLSTFIVLAVVAMFVSPAVVTVSAQNPTGSAPAQTEAKVASKPKPTPKEVREAQIDADAQKLYQLAQELKVEVDKSNKDTLSLAVIKKAAEIEKLARTLKQNMRVD